MTLSIVIINYKTPELLRQCLASIYEISPAKEADFDWEVLVVDSASERVSRDIVKHEFPNAKLLDFKKNLGFARGVNEGIKSSTGDFILILNPDTVMTEGAVESMLDYIQRRKDVAILAPQLLNFNDTIQQSYFSFYKPKTIFFRRSQLLARLFGKIELEHFLMAGVNPLEIQTPDWVIGGGMLVRRSAVDDVGVLDERVFMYFEDVDWARRFWHNGYKVVYYPDAKIYHSYPRESRSRLGLLGVLFNRKARWHLSSALKFFWKYRDLRKVPVKRHR